MLLSVFIYSLGASVIRSENEVKQGLLLLYSDMHARVDVCSAACTCLD